MKFIIKEWPDKSATLMTENGYALSTFDTAAEAHSACRAWYAANGRENPGPDQNVIQNPSCSTCALD